MHSKYRDTTDSGSDSPQSNKSKDRKSVAESLEKELGGSYPENASSENSAEEQTKKFLEVINSSVVKIIKLPSNRRNTKHNLHRKLVREMFLTNPQG